MPDELTEIQIQLQMKRLKIINGEQVKIPDVSQWEKVKKYVDKGNLTKMTRDDLETAVSKLFPLYVTIEELEDRAAETIVHRDSEISQLQVALAEEKEENLDVRDFLTRELQEKEEECLSLKEQMERIQVEAERERETSSFTNNEQLEELNTENMFLKRELEYAEAKLVGLAGGEQEMDETQVLEKELSELRKEKQGFQKEYREMNRKIKSAEMDARELRNEMGHLEKERDEARQEADEVKNAIKQDLAELEDEVSQQISDKDEELSSAYDKIENYERQLDRLEKKAKFLMEENAMLTGREDAMADGPNTGRKGGGGGGGIGNDEQLMYVKDQLDAAEKRVNEFQVKYIDTKSDLEEQLADAQDKYAEALAEKEELEEKAGHADQLQEWLEAMALEKEDALQEADLEISRMKAAFSKEKAEAIAGAVDAMQERVTQMEEQTDDANRDRLMLQETVSRVGAENDSLVGEVEALEVKISQMKFEFRMNAQSMSAESGKGMFSGMTGEVKSDGEREREALLKQLQVMNQKAVNASADAEKRVNAERMFSANKLEDMRVKFSEEAAQFSDQKDAEVEEVRKQMEVMDGDKQQLQRVTKALGKALKDKEGTIASLEEEMRDCALQLKNLQDEKDAVDEELAKTTAELEEALELKSEEQDAWKEDVQCMRLQKELDDAREEIIHLEERLLMDLEELEAAKKEEFDAMVAEKDREIEQVFGDAAEAMDSRSQQHDQEMGLKKFGNIMKNTVLRGIVQCIRHWEANAKSQSIGGLQILLEQSEKELQEIRSDDAHRLQKMRDGVKDDVEKIKQLCETEKDAARAAQSQLLFVTNMAKSQVEQAHNTTAVTKVVAVLAQWSRSCAHGVFQQWRVFTISEQALRWREKVGVGVMQSAAVDKATAVVDGIGHVQAKQEELECFLINELQNEFQVLVESQATIRKYRTAGMTADTVHDLELEAKRQSEKEWYVEKMNMSKKYNELTSRRKAEQDLFSEMQSKLYLEKEALEQQMSLMEQEMESVRLVFEKQQAEEVEEMMLCREELLSVAFRAGFNKVHEILRRWSHGAGSGVFRHWHANMYDDVSESVRTKAAQQKLFAEQLEATEFQALTETTYLKEEVQRLSKAKGLDTLKNISKRWAFTGFGSVFASWNRNAQMDRTKAELNSQMDRTKVELTESSQDALKAVESELFGEQRKVQEQLNYKHLKVKMLALGKLNSLLKGWKQQSSGRVLHGIKSSLFETNKSKLKKAEENYQSQEAVESAQQAATDAKKASEAADEREQRTACRLADTEDEMRDLRKRMDKKMEDKDDQISRMSQEHAAALSNLASSVGGNGGGGKGMGAMETAAMLYDLNQQPSQTDIRNAIERATAEAKQQESEAKTKLAAAQENEKYLKEQIASKDAENKKQVADHMAAMQSLVSAGGSEREKVLLAQMAETNAKTQEADQSHTGADGAAAVPDGPSASRIQQLEEEVARKQSEIDRLSAAVRTQTADTGDEGSMFGFGLGVSLLSGILPSDSSAAGKERKTEEDTKSNTTKQPSLEEEEKVAIGGSGMTPDSEAREQPGSGEHTKEAHKNVAVVHNEEGDGKVDGREASMTDSARLRSKSQEADLKAGEEHDAGCREEPEVIAVLDTNTLPTSDATSTAIDDNSSELADLDPSEVSKLLKELWDVETELHNQLIDTRALEMEYERLEGELAANESGSEVVYQDTASVSSDMLCKHYAPENVNRVTKLEIKLIRDTIADTERLVQEQGEENTSLEDEIERIEAEISAM